MAKTYLFWDPVEDNIVRECDEAGVVTAEYTTEPDLYGNVISQRRQGEYRQFQYDAQGSTVAATDESENVTDTFGYTAFGEKAESAGSTEVPLQYVGQEGYFRSGTREQYVVRRRVYDAVMSCWLTIDPRFSLEQSGGNADVSSGEVGSDFSPYVYASNNPVGRTDPSGLEDTFPCRKGGRKHIECVVESYSKNPGNTCPAETQLVIDTSSW